MSSINFLKASLKGRLGEVVGSSWRGKAYTKVYTPPGNPNTAGQKGVRSIFAHVGHIAHTIYKGVLDPYTFPIPRKMTKCNLMMQINRDLYGDGTWTPAKLKIFAGELQADLITSAKYRANNGELIVGWELGPGHDELDDAIVLLYYETTGETLYNIVVRGDQTTLIETAVLGTSLDISKLHVYLAFSQPPGAKYEHGQTSNTTYSPVTAWP
jgi:hypothetical protein